MYKREQISRSWKRPEAKKDCAGEGQQQFNRWTVKREVTIGETSEVVLSHHEAGRETCAIDGTRIPDLRN
jgi:hypothetical protein